MFIKQGIPRKTVLAGERDKRELRKTGAEPGTGLPLLLFAGPSTVSQLAVDEKFHLCSTHPVETSAYVALGSNLGDRELNLLRGVAEIGKLPGTRITALSGFYETQPVGPVEQDTFLNAVLRMETPLPPHKLLSELQRIETAVFGRKRTIKWGPRSMDLDILLYGNVTLDDENLTIPHPRMHERRFVLVPLAEIAPGLVHPQIGKSMAEILKDLDNDEQVRKI